MTVEGVTAGGAGLAHVHRDDVLTRHAAASIDPRTAVARAGHLHRRAGIGLKIANNRYGDRTFFSDNWPNRARHWLPTVDHPYDKATAEMIVTAPAHYQVVSNGLLAEQTDLPGGRRRTHWRQSVRDRPVALRPRRGPLRRAARRHVPGQGHPDLGLCAGSRQGVLRLRRARRRRPSSTTPTRSVPSPTRSWPTCSPTASAAAWKRPARSSTASRRWSATATSAGGTWSSTRSPISGSATPSPSPTGTTCG